MQICERSFPMISYERISRLLQRDRTVPCKSVTRSTTQFNGSYMRVALSRKYDLGLLLSALKFACQIEIIFRRISLLSHPRVTYVYAIAISRTGKSQIPCRCSTLTPLSTTMIARLVVIVRQTRTTPPNDTRSFSVFRLDFFLQMAAGVVHSSTDGESGRTEKPSHSALYIIHTQARRVRERLISNVPSLDKKNTCAICSLIQFVFTSY